MKAYEVSPRFGLENLKLVEKPDPKPGPGEVLLRMQAASLNYRDLLMVKGVYNPRQKLPLIPVSDGVGEVLEVGAGVDDVAVGERVAGLFAQNWLSDPPTKKIRKSTLGGPLPGMLSELAVLPASGVIRVPEHLSVAEAATLPCAALTAWNALFGPDPVKPGDTVLVLGTGGVSIFALQFACMAGARVIVTSKDDSKLERARKLGAAECVNYMEQPDWERAVLKFTSSRGADHVIEVGGAGTLEKSIRATRLGGKISLIGVLGGGSTTVDLRPILMGSIRVQGVFVGNRNDFENMNRALDRKTVVPVVDRVFDFEDTPAAFEFLAAGKHFGKVCIGFRC